MDTPNKEQIELAAKYTNRAAPAIPRPENPSPDSKGEAFRGYDNYLKSFNLECAKFEKCGCASTNYLLEKLISMQRRHEDALRYIKEAREALGDKP